MSPPRTLLSLIALAACAHAAHTLPAGGLVPEGTPDAVNLAAARARGAHPLIAWSPWRREVFDRARAEGRYVLLDGAAAWCHWCHVMDATTYAAPAVAAQVNAHFVAVRFDAEARPDLATRYAEWGWPATIVLSPEGEELERHRGYLTPEALVAMLDRARAHTPRAASPAPSPAAPTPLDGDALSVAGPWIAHQLDAAYDPAQGSWGTFQKLSLGDNLRFELRRAAHGDRAALARATFTLDRQRALYDPVAGGVYQYSAGATWRDLHFEKLMTFQSATLEALAHAYAVTHDVAHLTDARAIARYLRASLCDADGAFHATQDADVNAHDLVAPFIDGHVYYAADAARRRALGTPRVDPHVYARDNGLALAALAALFEASHDDDALALARRAADLVARTHVDADGRVAHEHLDASAVRYLADAAALGRGYATLAEALPEGPERARYTALATRIATAMLHDFATPEGALAARTADPDAPSSLARPDTPEGENITAARLLSTLSRLDGDARWSAAAARILAVMTLPSHAAARGRFVGDLLLALDEAGLYPWESSAPGAFTRHTEHATLTASLAGESLTLSLRTDGALHVNDRYPTTVRFEALDADAPQGLSRADAEVATADEMRLRATLHATGPRPVVRVRWDFALCGAERCQPETRWLVVAP